MAHVNIFLTLQNSAWFQNMLDQSKHGIGYEKESWTTRAMIALGPSGLVGKTLTINEIGDTLSPYVGFPESRHSLNTMVRRGTKRGIISKTGRKRYVEGTRNPYPEYEIHGHVEIDDCGRLHSVVGLCGKPNRGNDAGRSASVRAAGEIRTRKQAHRTV